MPDPTLIKLTWERIVEDNPDAPVDDLLELTANELACEIIDIVEVVMPVEAQ